MKKAHSDGKIAAIKFYREETGASLADAKDIVETLLESEIEDLPQPTTQPPAAGELQRREEIVLALQRGRKIEAIKIYRKVTGLGLVDSKEAIEQLQRELGIEIASSGKAGRLFLLLALTVAPALLYYYC